MLLNLFAWKKVFLIKSKREKRMFLVCFQYVLKCEVCITQVMLGIYLYDNIFIYTYPGT